MLDHMVIMCLNFCGNAILFSTEPPQFYIPTNSVQGLQFLHVLTDSNFSPFFFFNSHPNQFEVESYFIFYLHLPND